MRKLGAVMKVLVIGGGGREHALVWKLSQDRRRPQLFCAPGNAGTAALAASVPVAAEDAPGLLAWARAEKPDLTVVGPEAPLCAGIADQFAAAGLRVFGPCAAAARLEGSKVFSKEIMLAAGKGVIVAATREEAAGAVRAMLVERAFGAAGASVLIEEFLDGEEASILALVDGEHIVLLPASQDHKRILDGDGGPNTGGMGAYAPAPVVTAGLLPAIRDRILLPAVRELGRRGIVYRGVLYAGLMIGRRGTQVLEFNCRFGDPETEAVLPLIEGDLIPLLEACIDGTLDPAAVRVRPGACATIVMASGGYPGAYAKGRPIAGLEAAGRVRDAFVFHAGTARKDGETVTAGGRVLAVTATGADLRAAVGRAYEALAPIRFDGMQYRRDIGHRALGGKKE